MPSKRRSYSLYPRKTKKGKVYYYRAYTPDGERTYGKSTGETSKTAARVYCDELMKKGLLYQGDAMRFGDYAKGFFDDGSPWLADRMNLGTDDNPALAKSTIMTMRWHLKEHILPFFSKYKLTDIRPSKTKLFRHELLFPKDPKAKVLAPKTVNNVMSTFRTICESALADGVMVYDPMRGIKPLKKGGKGRDAFSIEETLKILEKISDKGRYAFIIGTLTGMRISEILAIRPKRICDNYLDVVDQFTLGEYTQVKTKEARKIPLPPRLKQFIEENPINANISQIEFAVRQAMIKAEVANVKERKLSFHSTRHFFNTYLLAENIMPNKVAAILGHSTGAGSAQETYTNWRPEQFPEVYVVQEKLLDILGL